MKFLGDLSTLFTSYAFLTLLPSGPSTFNTRKTVLTKAWNKPLLGKVTANFFMLYSIWTLPTDHSLFNGYFLLLSSSMSLPPRPWSHFLAPLLSSTSWISVIQVLLWALSPLSLSSLQTHQLPWLRPIPHSQQASLLNFLISSRFFYFIFFCKNYF